MTWEKVCKFEDILPNAGACVLVREKQIALFRLRDKLFAVGNYDPFSKANVIARGIVGDINGVPVVASPVYKQHFSLADGRCLEDPSLSIATYTTRLNGEAIEIMVE